MPPAPAPVITEYQLLSKICSGVVTTVDWTAVCNVGIWVVASPAAAPLETSTGLHLATGHRAGLPPCRHETAAVLQADETRRNHLTRTRCPGLPAWFPSLVSPSDLSSFNSGWSSSTSDLPAFSDFSLAPWRAFVARKSAESTQHDGGSCRIRRAIALEASQCYPYWATRPFTTSWPPTTSEWTLTTSGSHSQLPGRHSPLLGGHSMDSGCDDGRHDKTTECECAKSSKSSASDGLGRRDAARTGWTSTLWDMADRDCLYTLVLSECWGADGAQLVGQPRGDHRFWPFEVVAQPQMARILDLDRARGGR